MIQKDFVIVTLIGAGIGLFAQAVIANLVQGAAVPLRLGIFLGCIAFSPFALFVAHYVNKVLPGAYQFAKFSAVGTLNNAIDLGVLNTIIALTGIASGAAYPLFKAVSAVFATTNSFVWNKFWTFGAHQTAAAQEIWKFFAFALSGGALNVITASIVVNVVLPPPHIAPRVWANIGALAGVAVALVWDFFAYKFFVFRKHI